MKFTNAPLAAALLPVVAAQTKPCHPPVDSDKLQELIKSDAYAPCPYSRRR